MIGDKFRFRFSKSGTLRLVSHHDLMRCAERMLRRAAVPFKSTAGFHPTPRLVFALSLPLGVVGCDEVVELELTEPRDGNELLATLNAQAPTGMVFTRVAPVPMKATAQARRVVYEVPLPPDRVPQVEAAVTAFLAEPKVWVQRLRPSAKRLNIRPYVRGLSVEKKPLPPAPSPEKGGGAGLPAVLSPSPLGGGVGEGSAELTPPPEECVPPTRFVVRGQRVTDEKVRLARELRQEMTPAECALWEQVRANRLGHHFRRQQVIDGYIADFYCHTAALVIEVDGPVHGDQIEYDQRRTAAFAERGIRVMRFRNEEVLTNAGGVAAGIAAACGERTQPLPPTPSPKKGGGAREEDGTANAQRSRLSPSLLRGGVGEGFFLTLDLWVTQTGTARAEELLALLGLPDLIDGGAVLSRTAVELRDETTEITATDPADVPPDGPADAVPLTGPEVAALTARLSDDENQQPAEAGWGASPNGPVVE